MTNIQMEDERLHVPRRKHAYLRLVARWGEMGFNVVFKIICEPPASYKDSLHSKQKTCVIVWYLLWNVTVEKDTEHTFGHS